MKRLVYRVVPIKSGRGGWRIKTPSGPAQECATKATAVALARRWARADWMRDGQLSQLVIHKADGTIQEERTYGRDPERFPG